MRFIMQYPSNTYDVQKIPGDLVHVTSSADNMVRGPIATVHFRGDSVGDTRGTGPSTKGINASMTSMEARILGHRLLAAAESADAKLLRLTAKLEAERRARKEVFRANAATQAAAGKSTP